MLGKQSIAAKEDLEMKKRKDQTEQKIEKDIVTDSPVEYLGAGLAMDGTLHFMDPKPRNEERRR